MRNPISSFSSLLVILIIIMALLSPSLITQLPARHLYEDDQRRGVVEDNAQSKGEKTGSPSENSGSAGEDTSPPHPLQQQPVPDEQDINTPPSTPSTESDTYSTNMVENSGDQTTNFPKPPQSEDEPDPSPIQVTYHYYSSATTSPPPLPRPAYYSSSTGTRSSEGYYYHYGYTTTRRPVPTGYYQRNQYYRTRTGTVCPLYSRR